MIKAFKHNSDNINDEIEVSKNKLILTLSLETFID